jgi:hypothetical protein
MKRSDTIYFLDLKFGRKTQHNNTTNFRMMMMMTKIYTMPISIFAFILLLAVTPLPTASFTTSGVNHHHNQKALCMSSSSSSGFVLDLEETAFVFIEYQNEFTTVSNQN